MKTDCLGCSEGNSVYRYLMHLALKISASLYFGFESGHVVKQHVGK